MRKLERAKENTAAPVCGGRRGRGGEEEGGGREEEGGMNGRGNGEEEGGQRDWEIQWEGEGVRKRECRSSVGGGGLGRGLWLALRRPRRGLGGRWESGICFQSSCCSELRPPIWPFLLHTVLSSIDRFGLCKASGSSQPPAPPRGAQGFAPLCSCRSVSRLLHPVEQGAPSLPTEPSRQGVLLLPCPKQRL